MQQIVVQVSSGLAEQIDRVRHNASREEWIRRLIYERLAQDVWPDQNPPPPPEGPSVEERLRFMRGY